MQGSFQKGYRVFVKWGKTFWKSLLLFFLSNFYDLSGKGRRESKPETLPFDPALVYYVLIHSRSIY